MRTSLISIAAALTLLASGAVSAQGYVGGGIGWGRIGVDCSGLDGCDKTATGGKLYGGYLVNKQFGIELAYLDWGKVTASGTLDSTALSGKLRATGFGLAAAYMVPLSGDWGTVVRAGLVRNLGKVSFDGVGGSVSKYSVQPHFGLGVDYKLAPGLVLTGEADFSRVKYGALDIYESDAVHLISIGVRYAF